MSVRRATAAAGSRDVPSLCPRTLAAPHTAGDQTSTTFGTIIGRRRYLSLTQRPIVRRTTCWS